MSLTARHLFSFASSVDTKHKPPHLISQGIEQVQTAKKSFTFR
jgi:hypothetical protein